jgi:acetoin utilization protein AcuB
MKAIPPIKAVMTPFPYWIDGEASVERARLMMAERSIRHLPVMRGGRLVSVLTEREVQLASGETKVRDVCRMGAYVVGLSEPLDRVVLHMAEHHVGSALVVKDGKLAGIFTLTDACLCLGRLLRTLFPAGGDDAAA